MKKSAVLLLSGGLDSATTGAMAKAAGYENLYALSFRYGQRHAAELEAASRVAKMLGVKEHKFAEIDLRLFGGSALTADIAVPKNRSTDEMSHDIPITYVPARNTIFLSFALAYAEVRKAYDIFIGVNAVDYSGYPDCRPEFIAAFQQMARLATAYAQPSTINHEPKITIHTPLIHLTKAEIIQKGMALGVDYSQTLSCYDPSDKGESCGQCDSCQLRRKGFADAGVSDPTRYIYGISSLPRGLIAGSS
jgi:7-cyano-7-deazaguanine synthase